jgi:hypothetical protein
MSDNSKVRHDPSVDYPVVGPSWVASAPERDDIDHLEWPEYAVAILQCGDGQGEFDLPGYSWREWELYLLGGWPSVQAWAYPCDAPESSLAKAVSMFLQDWPHRPIRFERASVVMEVGSSPPQRHGVLVAFYADDAALH